MSPIIYALAAIGIVALVALPFLIWERSNVLHRVRELERQVSEKVVPFWRSVQEQMQREIDDPNIHETEDRLAQVLPIIAEKVELEAADEKPITEVQLVGIKK